MELESLEASKTYSLPELKRIRALNRQNVDKRETDSCDFYVGPKVFAVGKLAESVKDESEKTKESEIQTSSDKSHESEEPPNIVSDDIQKSNTTSLPELDLGFLYKILKLCLAARHAVNAIIIFTAIFNLVDGISDYTLAYFLLKTGFFQSALIIIAIDYGVFFITLSHYLMANIAGESCMRIIAESLFITLLHPITPALSALSWLIARSRGLEEGRPHYFTKMTSLIQGCAEAPSQLVATTWMILIHQLEVPWNKSSLICDKWGNCIHLGNLLPMCSLFLSWISLLVASLNSFQASDPLAAIGLLLPNICFRLGSTVILITFMEVWCIGPFLILIMVNIAITCNFYTEQTKKYEPYPNFSTGINFVTTILVSIFTFNILPTDPAAKEKTGRADIDPDRVRRIAPIMVSAGATVMLLSLLSLYCILRFTNFKTNDNIMIREDQLHFLLWFILTPFYFTVLISSVDFYLTYNQPMVMCKKLLVNAAPIVLVIGIVASSAPFYPPGVNRLLIAIKTTWCEETQMEIVSGFALGTIEKNENCSVENSTDFFLCGDFFIENEDNLDAFKMKFTSNNGVKTLVKLGEITNKHKNTEIILTKHLLSLKEEKNLCFICKDNEDNFCKHKLGEALKLEGQQTCGDSYQERQQICIGSNGEEPKVYDIMPDMECLECELFEDCPLNNGKCPSKTKAIQDFDHGITCGKRDSRVYYDADLEEGYTNPGEWPWAVLIYNDGAYIGAGAFMDYAGAVAVVTVGHIVKDFGVDPSGLTVRLGDWNPNEPNELAEEFPYIEVPVKCVKIQGDFLANNVLQVANNVAVLKLRSDSGMPPHGKNIPRSDSEGRQKRNTRVIPRSYINTVCFPHSEHQFENHQENCWVAAWGKNMNRQREVDLPLVNTSECEKRLGPVFRERDVRNWTLKQSEVCAGGVPGKDACEGEDGAPLVCYDKISDQFFAVGLMNYWFDCNTDKPAVYTNLADPSVKQFIRNAIDNNFC